MTWLLWDPYDIRDHKVEHMLGAGNENPPRKYQLEVWTIYDQWNTMHCVAYSTTKIHEIENTIEHKRQLHFVASKLAEAMEDDWTMKKNWAYLVDWMKAVVKYWSVWDWIYWATWYASVHNSKFREWISKWYPILTGLYTKDWKGKTLWEHCSKTRTWWHAVCISWYDDDKEELTIVNSWWEDFWDNGKFRIRYKDIEHLFSFRILYDKKDMKKLYKDLTDKSWAYDAVKWATEKGVVKGYDDWTFRPDALMTRAEVVQVIYNALK